MFDPDGLLFITALAAVVAAWVHVTRMRERAHAIAGRLCRDLSVQYLDDTVVLVGVRPHTPFGPARRIEWRYAFEFSLGGADRLHGRLALDGRRLLWARLDTPEGALYVDEHGDRHALE